MRAVKRSDFHFDLPPELIAQEALDDRAASRLLVLDADGRIADRNFRDLPALLAPGDLLVFNDTRVLPARLHGHKDSGGQVEILVERLQGEHEALAQVRASKPPRPGRLTWIMPAWMRSTKPRARPMSRAKTEAHRP